MSNHRPIIHHINRYISGDDTAGDRVCTDLEQPLRNAVRAFLSPQDPDCDDIIQDSLIAFLRYVRQAQTSPDNPEAFAVTIARNRCTNLRLWRRRRVAADVDEFADRLPHIAVSALDLVEAKQRRDLLQQVLLSLDRQCRHLLQTIYGEQATIEELRQSLGLKSVQAVYYRRDICLKKAGMFLNRRLFVCRSVKNPQPGLRLFPGRGKETVNE